MKRISCIDLALGYACDRIFEAETDEEVLEQALAHARDEHGREGFTEDEIRSAMAATSR